MARAPEQARRISIPVRLMVVAATIVLAGLCGAEETPPAKTEGKTEGAADPRLPIPPAAALAETERQIKDIFKEEYQKKGTAEREELARRMLKLAGESKNDAFAYYVALRESKDLAVSAGDLETAFSAIDALASAFVADEAALKTAALAAVARSAATPEIAEKAFAVGFGLLEHLANDTQYDAALKLVGPLDDLARRANKPELAKAVAARLKDLRAAQAEWAKVKPSLDRLKANPDDPEACLTVGRYHLATKGDWERALPLLAKCSAPAFKEAAARDLLGPETATAQADVCDLWWALTGKESGPLKTALQVRAAHWYSQACDGLAAARKQQTEKRLQTLDDAVRTASGIIADKVVLWNMHNGSHANRGAAQASVILLSGRKEVYAAKDLKVPWDANKDTFLEVPLPPKPFTSVRVEVTAFHGSGGGLAEVQVMRGGTNLALGRPVTSSPDQPAPGHPGAEALTDGITTSAEYGKGYWCLPDATPGSAEIVLKEVRPADVRATAAPAGSASGPSLLALVNPVKDAVAGVWKSDGHAVTSDNATGARIMFPYAAPEEYDVRMEFTRVSGSSTVSLILSKAGHAFDFEIARPDGIAGFECIDGKSLEATPGKAKFTVTTGRKYSVVVQVRNAGLRALVDGKQIVLLPADYKGMTVSSAWRLPNAECLGIGSYNSPTTFHAVDIIEVTGKGKRMR
ncbi:MAG: hypothetical protein NTW87_28820 [Planctomycetota bacterium]|nr:hypothetical protein [Planctomycetota bacterium]